MTQTHSHPKIVWLLLLLLGACASETPPEPVSKKFDQWKIEWENRVRENEKTARQRAGLLPDALEKFGSENTADWQQARASLLVLEKQQRGFVYARILVLIDPAVRADEKGKQAREELVEIGQIIRLASRIEPSQREAWTETRTALQALGSKGVDAAAVRFILLFRTQNPEIIGRVQEQLLALGVGAIRHLALALQSESATSDIKERCTDTLVQIGSSALPALLPLLSEKGRSARYWAAKVCGRMKNLEVLGPLSEAEAREADPYVRCMMLEALTVLGGPLAVKAAIRALAAEDLSVVKFGAKGVARLNASEGVPALVDALERAQDPSSRDVRDEILAALRLLTGIPGGSDPAFWRARLPR
ncbi:MAG: HEAT repeat domain-containing protein [Planctomycetota bacterium]